MTEEEIHVCVLQLVQSSTTLKTKEGNINDYRTKRLKIAEG
jgi:hypothetical protein